MNQHYSLIKQGEIDTVGSTMNTGKAVNHYNESINFTHLTGFSNKNLGVNSKSLQVFGVIFHENEDIDIK